MSRVEQLNQLDAICDAFESEIANGKQVAIETILDRVVERDRPTLLHELLAIEIAHRLELGESPQAEDYLARFRDHALLIQRLISENVQAGSTAGSETPQFRQPEQVGDYVILDEIARGGMGVVYRARQKKLNREVALKMVLSGQFASPQQVQRFLDEAKVVATLQHPHIVQVYDLGEFEGQPFISLELVSGGNLADRLSGQPQDPIWSAQIIRDVAEGVDHAHTKGVIHRDLKPSNILLTEKGVVRIADFGLARQLDRQSAATKTGDLMGTPYYMSPEQAAGRVRDIGPASDVYSMGAVLYEMLTGQPPFRKDSTWGTVNAVIQDAVVAPGKLVEDLPRDLEVIVLKCLEKDPTKRYASAIELADDLQRWRSNQPIHARPPSAATRAVGRILRYKWPAAVVSLITAIAIAFAMLNPKADQHAAVHNEVPLAKSFTNSIGMNLVYVPPGEFQMGAGQFVPGDPDDQVPQHLVRLTEPFFIGASEVTVQQFRSFIDATDYEIDTGMGFDSNTGLPDTSGTSDWTNPGWLQTDNHPVVNVSWHDATAFCSWLSESENRTYRLPTEAEWEYACRAGTNSVYFSGNDPESLRPYANVADRSFRRMMEKFNDEGYYDYTQTWNDGFPFTAPVGQFRANPFGLFDMHGNVQEWCSDWYAKHYYSVSPSVDPTGPPTGTTRVKRGGDWSDYINICRCSFRRSELEPTHHTYMVGFRVVCDHQNEQ